MVFGGRWGGRLVPVRLRHRAREFRSQRRDHGLAARLDAGAQPAVRSRRHVPDAGRRAAPDELLARRSRARRGRHAAARLADRQPRHGNDVRARGGRAGAAGSRRSSRASSTCTCRSRTRAPCPCSTRSCRTSTWSSSFASISSSGPDRVTDTDQLSFGVTTRLIDAANGRERLTASLGQTRYLNAQLVTLPGTAPTGTDASDYVAEVGIGLRDAWELDVGYQWNSETSSTARTETRLEYRPKDDRLFGFGYRYRRDPLEQGDVSVVWPARAALAHHRQLQLLVPREGAARALRRLGVRGLLLAVPHGQPQLREPPHRRVRQRDLDPARAEGPVATGDLAGGAPRPWYSGLSEYRPSQLRSAIP